MKKFVLFILILWSASVTAQITLDTTIYTWNAIGYDFYPVKLSTNETKYYIQDTLSNTFTLYNLDFTPFLQNVSVPEPYLPFSHGMSVIYLSRTLFDCDSSNIEYAYTAIGPYYRPFYIMRTDGTELFKLDSSLAPWALGTLNGSQDIRPIMNTEDGAKLFLYYPSNTKDLNIYSLCGSLPTGFNIIINKNEYSIINVFPNPSTGLINFQINLPDNIFKYELIIYSSSGNELIRKPINGSVINNYFDLNVFSSGNYFYKLISETEEKVVGKFIIQK
jgi:hypothetical protein